MRKKEIALTPATDGYAGWLDFPIVQQAVGLLSRGHILESQLTCDEETERELKSSDHE